MGTIKKFKQSGRFVLLVLALVFSGCAGDPAVSTVSEGIPKTGGDGHRGDRGKSVAVENNYRVGISYLDEGSLDEARAVLELVGREMPESVEVRNALGVLYRRLGQPEKAVSEYKAALSLIQKGKGEGDSLLVSSHLHNNLGISLRESGDFRGAERAYKNAIRLNSGFPDPYYNLGVLYDLYMGRAREALKYYKGFLSLAGKDKEVELWVKDLEQKQKLLGKQKNQ